MYKLMSTNHYTSTTVQEIDVVHFDILVTLIITLDNTV